MWIASLYMTSRWKYFWHYFVANILIFIGYFTYLLNADLVWLGHDEYGLQRLFMMFLFPSIHVIIGFLIAIFIRYKSKK